MSYLAVVCGFAIPAAGALAGSVSLDFSRIEPSNNVENLGTQLTVDVISILANPNQVEFTFRNNVGIESSVSEIYFDDNGLLGAGRLTQSGADFTLGAASPPVLPGGQNLLPPFQVTTNLLADRGSGNPRNGLDAADDFVTIQYDLLFGQTFDDVFAALRDGDLRIGLHVISIGVADDSDSYVTNPPDPLIPLPSTAAMAGVGLLGLAMRRRRPPARR